MARPARRSASPWCGCGAKVTIAQVTREDLVDQHVSRLDPNADLCNEADHRVRAFCLFIIIAFLQSDRTWKCSKKGPYKSLVVNVGHVYTDVAAMQRESPRPRFQAKRFCHL
jgi:hypothetical protein